MTAGTAATRPIAVANSASAMWGPTVSRVALPLSAIDWNATMMPMTVPNRPMNGAADAVVARNGVPDSSRVVSSVCALRSARTMLSRLPSASAFMRSSADSLASSV